MQVLDLMSEYFDRSQDRPSLMCENTEPRFLEWEKVTSPERLIRDYDFSNRPAALEFLRQLFLYEDSLNHHAKITLDHDTVRIEVSTRTIAKVTELDAEYASAADQIYMDVNYTCQNI